MTPFKKLHRSLGLRDYLFLLRLHRFWISSFIGRMIPKPPSSKGLKAGSSKLLYLPGPLYRQSADRHYAENATRPLKVFLWSFHPSTLPKTNMDTRNDGLEKVTPFKHGNFWYQFVRFLGCKLSWLLSPPKETEPTQPVSLGSELTLLSTPLFLEDYPRTWLVVVH